MAMSERKRDRLLLAKQVLILVSRISVILILCLSVLLIAINKIWPDFTEKYKTEFADVLYPVTQVFGTAARSVGDYLEAVDNVLNANTIARKAEDLQKENFKARLKIYLMQEELEKLKEKLSFLPTPDKKFYTARMVARSPGPIIEAGYIRSDDIEKIEKDNIVINEDGLVGQIEAVGDGVANVILITDKRSNVPVKSKNYGKRAILVGTGSKNPRLDYIISTNKLSLGEEILTSGDGGVFPSDIPVGYVKEINKGQVIIETYADWSALEYVFILK
jgi:rod shape-determining protein MreC